MTSHEEILRRVRDGLRALPDDEHTGPVARAYPPQAADVSPIDHAAIVELFAERLTHYDARVHRIDESQIAATLHAVLTSHGVESVIAPDGLPRNWLAAWAIAGDHRIRADLPADDPDRADALVTTCAGAVADSGTVVLDGGPGQGRHAPTLLPDRHICVVRAAQVVSSLPDVLDRLDPLGPVTFFSGPSATVDLEMTRRHGPRRLDVIIME